MAERRQQFADILSEALSHYVNNWTLLCRISGSVFPKALLWAIPSGCLAAVLHPFLNNDHMRGEWGDIAKWTSYDVILGMLMVFRTNQAYSRYWEGLTLLSQVRGEWFNATSSLIAFCSTDQEKREDVERFQHLLVRLMSMLYCAALQQVAEVTDGPFEILDISGMDEASLEFLSQSMERPEVILQWIQRLICDSTSSGVVSASPPILSRAYQELSRGIVNLTNVRKIADVPFPFPYTQMVAIMLLILSVIAPFQAAFDTQAAGWASVTCFFKVLFFWALDYIAAELEQPFGEDFNDIPLSNMLNHMNMSLRKLLDRRTQLPPLFAYDRRLQAQCTTVLCSDCGFAPQHRERPAAAFGSAACKHRRNNIKMMRQKTLLLRNGTMKTLPDAPRTLQHRKNSIIEPAQDEAKFLRATTWSANSFHSHRYAPSPALLGSDVECGRGEARAPCCDEAAASHAEAPKEDRLSATNGSPTPAEAPAGQACGCGTLLE